MEQKKRALDVRDEWIDEGKVSPYATKKIKALSQTVRNGMVGGGKSERISRGQDYGPGLRFWPENLLTILANSWSSFPCSLSSWYSTICRTLRCDVVSGTW